MRDRVVGDDQRRPEPGSPVPRSGLQTDRELVARQRRWLDMSQRHTESYETTVAGLEFIVLPEVFSPRYFPESEFYAELVARHVRPGIEYLDVGCGVGVTACLAARARARVVALDVNSSAVANTTINLARHVPPGDIDVRASDVYSALRPDERFDVVFWNVPFTHVDDTDELTPLEEAVFDPGHDKAARFIEGLPSRLRPNGVALIGVSSTLGNAGVIERLLDDTGMDWSLVAERDEAMQPDPVMLQLLVAHLG